MVQFSAMQLGIFVLIMALLVGVIAWAVLRIARMVPPALTKPGYASGVGGLLLIVVLFFWLQAVVPLFRLGREGAEVARVAFMEADYFWAAFQTLIPDLVAAVTLTAAALMLTIGRSARSLTWVLLLAWVGAPVVAFLRAWLLNIPLTLFGEPTAMLTGMIVTTLYLLFADRSVLTYGLPRAATLPDRQH